MATTALVDTGSPVSIVSLDFFLKASAANREQSQTPDAWGEAVRQRLKPATMYLRSFGGANLPIIGQAVCSLAAGHRKIHTHLQIQEKAPVELLLGTDILYKLGFSLVHLDQGDLLTDTPEPQQNLGDPVEPNMHTARQKVLGSTSSTTGATVKLIQAARVPAGHAKLIRAELGNGQMTGDHVFEPALKSLHTMGLSMADAVVAIGEGGEVNLVVANHGREPVHLEKGQVLGEMEPTTVLESNETIGKEKYEQKGVVDVAVIVEGDGCGGREAELLTTLALHSADLQRDELKQLEELVMEFSDLFALNNAELGKTTLTTHRIDTGNSAPLRQPPRRVPFVLRSKVNTLVDDMLDQGVVVPSSSPWASPVVLVAKKDGSTRFCVDYRRLNTVTKLDVYPLPRIDDSLDVLAGTRYFSSLDLASGYWQVGMDKDSQEKTAFTTYAGLYEFTVMPFGLCNAPATFQRLMEKVLHGLAREKCLIYLDDVLVIGHTFQEHLDNLREVFTRLSKAGLRLKPANCKLARRQVEFLGYVYSV